jgi:hypothetical protein
VTPEALAKSEERALILGLRQKRRLPAPKFYNGLRNMGLMVDLSVIYVSDETKTLPSLLCSETKMTAAPCRCRIICRKCHSNRFQ